MLQDAGSAHRAAGFAQSIVGSAHVTLHEDASAHASKPAQAAAIGVEQVPVPLLHWLAGVSMDPVQEAAGHVGVMQQTESTHVRVPAQSAVVAHATPAGRPVHCPVVVLQVRPLTQWASIVQVPLHMVPLHAKFPQAVVAPGGHIPVPLHVEIAIAPAPGEAQEAAPHVTLAPTFWHPPAVHAPVSFKQGSAFVVMLHSTSVPVVTPVQVPSLPVTLHAWQAPTHPLLQQRPSTQLPDVQSVPTEHKAPLASLSPQPCVVRLHVTPDPAHCGFDVHMVRQVVADAHAKPPVHALAVAAVHVPLPSQLRAGVRLPAEQMAAAQLVPTVVLAHAPDVHRPV
jgi:hypothetical protein